MVPPLYFGTWTSTYFPDDTKTTLARLLSFASPGGRCLGYYWDLYMGAKNVYKRNNI